jgi:hypothetical protein
MCSAVPAPEKSIEPFLPVHQDLCQDLNLQIKYMNALYGIQRNILKSHTMGNHQEHKNNFTSAELSFTYVLLCTSLSSPYSLYVQKCWILLFTENASMKAKLLHRPPEDFHT